MRIKDEKTPKYSIRMRLHKCFFYSHIPTKSKNWTDPAKINRSSKGQHLRDFWPPTSQILSWKPRCSSVLMLKPSVGAISVMSSPLNFFRMVVLPALSSPKEWPIHHRSSHWRKRKFSSRNREGGWNTILNSDLTGIRTRVWNRKLLVSVNRS